MNTYSSNYNILEVSNFQKMFEGENCEITTPQYMYFQARKKGLTASFYQSGKFVIQGALTEEIVEKYFEKVKKTSDVKIEYPHIGVDESGKGDFFGPLVIAGVYLREDDAMALRELGAKDSKKITDKEILRLAPKIKEKAIYNVIAISPLKYNELYQSFKNLNKLLAWGHSSVIENILNKVDCKIALCDKFADDKVIINALKTKGKTIKVIQKTHGEEDVAVACASILAREEFIKRMDNICKKYEINLPKGASNQVKEAGVKFVQKYSKDELKHVSKTHFKTYLEIQ